MAPTDETDATDATDEDDVTDGPAGGPEDPTAIAEDGMAPLINNTGADGGSDDDADASSG